MSNISIFKDDIGVTFVVSTTAVVTGASVVRIKYKMPSGITGYWTATITSPTSISYTTIAADIAEVGLWLIQAYVELGSEKLSGTWDSFYVTERIV